MFNLARIDIAKLSSLLRERRNYGIRERELAAGPSERTARSSYPSFSLFRGIVGTDCRSARKGAESGVVAEGEGASARMRRQLSAYSQDRRVMTFLRRQRRAQERAEQDSGRGTASC